MDVHFIDTSVFLNIIDVPGRNQQREQVLTELRELIRNKEHNVLILPFATIVETGNHIAKCDNGRGRRSAADRFVDCLRKTVLDEAPWKFYSKQFSDEDLLEICKGFPDHAMRGMSFGDLSIIQAYNRYKDETPSVNRIRIWSIDNHLCNIYDEIILPQGLRNKENV